MERVVTIDNGRIPVTIKRNLRTKGVRIIVSSSDGSVRAIYGRFVTFGYAVRSLESKVSWIQAKRDIFSKKNPVLLVTHSKKELQVYYKQALELVTAKLEEFNSYYKFEYKKVTIRNNKTRWGSCSAQKNLSFYYKIIFLPENLQNYLVVHELCHLKEFNHGKTFWELVGERIGDYKELNKALKIGDFE